MGLPIQNVGVNISPKQLVQLDFTDMVADILADTGMEQGNLVLEVTESSYMENAELVIQSLDEVRCLGVSVAINHFGTGYSSLSYLRKIPLDILKIDRSFVIETNTINGAAICEMLITLSNRLGLKVVAAGVETQQQLQCLQRSDWIQGYYISHPLSADEFIEKVRDFSLSAEATIKPLHKVHNFS